MTARHRNKSFAAGCREETLRIATRIRTLPKNAVEERTILKAERQARTPIGNSDVVVKFAIVVRVIGFNLLLFLAKLIYLVREITSRCSCTVGVMPNVFSMF